MPPPRSGDFTLHSGAGQVQALAWSPDASRLLATHQDGTMAVLDLPRARMPSPFGHTKAVRGASWSPDGRRIASGSYDNTAKIWDAATGKELFTLRGHADSVQGAAWSPDSRASGDREQGWNDPALERRRRQPDPHDAGTRRAVLSTELAPPG